MVKKYKLKKISKCYKKSIKKYNKCIDKVKCVKKTCEQKCWNKGKKTYKKCKKKSQKGGFNSTGDLMHINSNNKFIPSLLFFPNSIELSNNMNNGQNNNHNSWSNWYQNYLKTIDPNSNYGSLDISESML